MFTPLKRKLLKTSLPIPVYNKETNNFQKSGTELKNYTAAQAAFCNFLTFLLFLLTVL